MSEGYTVLSLGEVEPAPHRGCNLIAVRHLLGFRPAGVNAWRADAGEQLIPPHEEESGDEELYVVVRGRATFTVGEEEASAAAGTLVFVPPGVFRTATAEEEGTIVFVAGGTVGTAFRPDGWDTIAVAEGFRQSGRQDDGRRVIERMVSDSPDDWASHYNAGCWEALAGNPDAALEHLRRAKELDLEGQSASYFREDTDLDSLRDDPRFQELLG